jgi:hypothetical protein
MTNNQLYEPHQAQAIASIAIENIEEMRRREGIDDEELHGEISRLKVGDLVRLTLRVSRIAAETVIYRITAMQQMEFRGECASLPFDTRLRRLTNGMTLCFTADHIHSVHQLGSVRC